jgi:imidazolonepropionase-like amidohydrolase
VGGIREHAAILILDGRIAVIGHAGDVRAPDGVPAEVIEYGDATILPGLVDAHTHLVSPGDGSDGDDVAAEPDDLLLLRAARNARAFLEAGNTTIRENGAKGRVAFSLREAIGREIVPGPHLVIAGRPIATTGGHLSYFGSEADGPARVRLEVRRLARDGVDWIKITATGGSTRTSNWKRPSFSVPELAAIVDEAHRHDLVTGAHCTAAQGVENALDGGVDMLIHCMFYGPDGRYRYRPDLVERIVRDERWVNPTLYNGVRAEIDRLQAIAEAGPLTPAQQTSRADLDRQWDELLDAAARMIASGVRMVAGSDTPWQWAGPGGLAQEIACLAAAGLSTEEALAAGTSRAAEAIRVADRAGVLAQGRPADLAVVRGDPLADLGALRTILAVWQTGRLAHAPTAPA